MKPQDYQALVEGKPELKLYLEYNRGSWRNQPYYRAVPYHRFKPTVAQLKHRLNFALSTFQARGRRGLRLLDGTPMPQACSAVREETRGKATAEMTTEEKRNQITRQRAEELKKRVPLRTLLMDFKDAFLGSYSAVLGEEYVPENVPKKKAEAKKRETWSREEWASWWEYWQRRVEQERCKRLQPAIR